MLSILGDIFDAIKAIFNFIIGTLGAFITAIIDFIKDITRVITNFFDSLTDFITDLVDFLKYIPTYLSNVADSFIDFLKDFLPILIDKFTETFTSFLQSGIDSSQSSIDSLMSAFTSSVNSLSGSGGLVQTAYYCIYMSDFSDALIIISYGVLILLGRKILAIITFGFIKI